MVKHGLLDEVRTMRQLETDRFREGLGLDKSKGIWVAIGYKEVEPWLDAHDNNLSDGNQDDGYLFDLEKTGIEAVKAGTWQYPKRQDHLRAASSLDKLFLLDCTYLEAWEGNVSNPSKDIVDKFLFGEELPVNTSVSERASQVFEVINNREDENDREGHFCETRKTLMGEREWKCHLKSQSHKKVLDGIYKRAQRDEYLAKRNSQRLANGAKSVEDD